LASEITGLPQVVQSRFLPRLQRLGAGLKPCLSGRKAMLLGCVGTASLMERRIMKFHASMHPRQLLPLLKQAASDWVDDGAMRLSSSLAYYAIFSLAPLLVIVISMAGLFFGEEAARGQLSQEISTLAGWRAGEAIQSAVQSSAAQKATGLLATILSTAVLLFGASTVFAELKDALNTVWGVVVKPGGRSSRSCATASSPSPSCSRSVFCCSYRSSSASSSARSEST
jgi:hypothetical protein